jgi:hypothetical protein
MNTVLDHERLKDIIEKHLFGAPNEAKVSFVPVLRNPDVSWFTFSTDKYFILTFIDAAGKKRIDELLKISHHPFPGLIAEKDTAPTAFHFEKSLNAFLKGYSVPPDMFSLSLGEDATVILCNHTQAVKTLELGEYEYVMELAYVVSFGKEINTENMCDFIENSIIYSIKQWTSQRGGQPPRKINV